MDQNGLLNGWINTMGTLWSATRFPRSDVTRYARDMMLGETRRGLATMALLSLIMNVTALCISLIRDADMLSPHAYTFSLLAALSLHVMWSARMQDETKALNLLGMVLLVVSGAAFMLLAHRLGTLSAPLMAGVVLLFMAVPLVPWGMREAATVISLVYLLLTLSALSVAGRFDRESLLTFEFLILGAALTAAVLVGRNVRTRKDDIEARFALEEAHSEMEMLSNVDPMTGAWNRRYLEGRFDDIAETCRSERRDLHLALMDVDSFKLINDSHGHHHGDEILRRLARIFLEHLPGNACLFRLGGDEFAVLYPGDGLEELVDRCLNHLATDPELLRTTHGVPVHVSTGYATLEPEGAPSLDTLYRVADKNLYIDKRSGRGSGAQAQAEPAAS